VGTENRVALLFPAAFWPADPHFLRPLAGRYTYINLHALGVPNVLCAWIRPHVSPQGPEPFPDLNRQSRLSNCHTYINLHALGGQIIMCAWLRQHLSIKWDTTC